jgi:prepilin-type N-terminal cleavage/methylation domain-containing protein
MSFRGGFTLVELIITMVIMTILIALGTVAVSGYQSQARDKERESDVEAIARGLEIRYTEGNPRATGPGVEKGSYPSVNEMLHILGYDRTTQGFVPGVIAGGYTTDALPGTNKDSLTSPTGNQLYISCQSSCQPAENMTFIESITTTGPYVYEPVTKDGNVCYLAEGCVRFNMYYRTETDSLLHRVKSKHQ